MMNWGKTPKQREEDKQMKKPLLIDVNLDENNIPAVVGALQSETYRVVGVSCVHGLVSMEAALYNTKGVLGLYAEGHVPIAMGASLPQRRDHLLPVSEKTVDSAIDGIHFEEAPTGDVVTKDAVEFMYSTIMGSEQPMTIFALGPLTNLANLVGRYPEVKGKIERIVFKGGAQHRGIINPVCDLECYMDPEAADFIFRSGLKVEMCSVDLIEQDYLTREEIDKLLKMKGERAHQMVRLLRKLWCEANFTEEVWRRHKNLGAQALAAAYHLEHPEESIAQDFYCEMDLTGELTWGMAIVDISGLLDDEKEKNISLVQRVPREKMVDYLYRLVEEK